MIEIKALPAKNGEALLIKTHETAHRGAVLIDGGYTSTFAESIRPELEALAQSGYHLDLVVASHIDADHVSGLISFFKANGDAAAPNIIHVGEVWHNSLRSLTGLSETSGVKDRADEEILTGIRTRGFPTAADAKPSEISAMQGSSLAALLLGGGYRWNGGNGMQTIGGDGCPSCDLTPNLRIKRIGPLAARLDALRCWWTAEMRRRGFMGTIGSDARFDDAFEFLAAHEDSLRASRTETISLGIAGGRNLTDVHLPDDSIINGSSIAFILEHQSSRVLFLGDACPADTEAVLGALGMVGRPSIFDAIKIAHHGSMRNTSPLLLQLIDSPRYLICTNGDRHGHPDIEVLKAIVDRPSKFRRVLHFNYPTPASHFMKSYSSGSGAAFLVVEGFSDWIRVEPFSQL
jgi:hypothetical protein